MSHVQADIRRNVFFWMVVVAIGIRLATLGAYPLTDNTEARYAEVAREMMASGNWVVPQLHGEKFWSKPPLSIWATAGSMSLFGKNEFAARLPSLIFSLSTAALVFLLLTRQRGRDEALAAGAVLATTGLFFLSSGAVMTDAALAFGTTLSMVAFWLAMQGGCKGSRLWGYLFFVGLAEGLLAKGPVAGVLIFLPVGLWTVWQQSWKAVWQRIPWAGGLVVTAALTLPWYLAAEHQTPGFLEYFLIGEHWKRFVDPGWAGDMYGSAHAQPRGMIWLFWIIAAFPWSILLLGTGWRHRSVRQIVSRLHKADAWTAYLVLWAAAPMLFFTLAGNILWTYVLPGLPAFSALMAGQLVRAGAGPDKGKRLRLAPMVCSGLVPMVFLAGIVGWGFVPYKNSQKILAERFHAIRQNGEGRLVYFFDRPYSAEFYAESAALKEMDPSALNRYFQDDIPDYFAVKENRITSIPPDCRSRMKSLGVFDGFALFGEKVSEAQETSADLVPGNDDNPTLSALALTQGSAVAAR